MSIAELDSSLSRLFRAKSDLLRNVADVKDYFGIPKGTDVVDALDYRMHRFRWSGSRLEFLHHKYKIVAGPWVQENAAHAFVVRNGSDMLIVIVDWTKNITGERRVKPA